MKKSLITLIVISIFSTPCFAKGFAPNARDVRSHHRIEHRAHHIRPLPPRHHMGYAPIVYGTTVIVDYNIAGRPVRVTRYGNTHLLNHRFYL